MLPIEYRKVKQMKLVLNISRTNKYNEIRKQRNEGKTKKMYLNNVVSIESKFKIRF